jgi:RNA methyltransferase, TrmH family
VYVVEGIRLVREALSAGQTATLALYCPELLARSPEGDRLVAELDGWAGSRYEVDERVLKAAAGTEHPAGVLAVLKRAEPPPLSGQGENAFGVILDTVSDPGNAGTIARTAAAAGAGYLISAPRSVDLFGPKVVRAGMGAHFRLALYSDVDWPEMRRELAGVTLVAASEHAERTYLDFHWPARCALVVGSEAHGLSPEAEGSVQERVRIPMQAGVESLNAAIAAGILIYAARASSFSGEPERYK